MERLSQTLAQGDSALVACARSAEGVLCAIGITYLAHAKPDQVRLATGASMSPRIGETIVDVPEDVNLAERVMRGLERRVANRCAHARGGRCGGGCTESCVNMIHYAALSDSEEMPQAIHEYARLCFDQGNRVRNNIADPRVRAVDDLASYVVDECERTRQFVRFRQLNNGLYYSLFRPRANTLPATAGYFRSRMGTTPFCMLDPNHGIGVFSNERIVVTKLDPELVEQMRAQGERISEDERYIQQMWRTFYDQVSLTGRDSSMRGYDLRASWMPKRFWRDMPDMAPRVDPATLTTPLRYRGKAQENSNGVLSHAEGIRELPQSASTSH